MAKFIIRPGVDIPAMLKARGYSSYRIAKDGIFGSAAMTKFRNRGLPSWGELAKLITLLHVSPVDLIAFQTDGGAVYDLTGKIRLDAPTPEPPRHYDYDDDDLPPAIPPEYIR